MQDTEAAISKQHVLILVSVVGFTSLLGMLERQKAGHSEVGQRGTFSHLPFSCPLTSQQGSIFRTGEEVSRSGLNSFAHEDGLAHLQGGIIKELKKTC